MEAFKVLVAFLTYLRVLEATTKSNMYKLAYITKDAWNIDAQQPDTSKIVGSSLRMCSMLCQSSESCIAFRMNNEIGCEFGSVDDCSVQTSTELSTTIKVYLDLAVYNTKQVIEMATAPRVVGPHPPHTHGEETGCSGLLHIPEPTYGPFDSTGGYAPFKTGWMYCSGHAAYLTTCQSWEPGLSSWKTEIGPMNYAHVDAGMAAFGTEELIIVGNKGDAVARTEVMEGGTWVEKADLPIVVRFMRLIAVNSKTAYSIGGEFFPDIPTTRVFRYTRNDNKWTEVAAMPLTLGGSSANCILVTSFRGKRVILCFGTTREEGQMISFDLETETWEDLGMTAPTPPNFRSTMFVQDNVLYRYGGIGIYPSYAQTNKMASFDLQTETWSQQQDITPILSQYSRFLFRLKVISKLT